MKRPLDRLISMIPSSVALLSWIAIALAPIAVLLGGLRVADRRQRGRSKHVWGTDDTEQ